MGDGGFDGQSLLDLGKINEILKIYRKPEVAKHRLGNPGVAASVFLVAFHHRGGNVEIRRISKFTDHVHRRIGLKAELRTKPRAYIAVMVKIAALVPDRPKVHVALAVIVPRVAKIHRAGAGG